MMLMMMYICLLLLLLDDTKYSIEFLLICANMSGFLARFLASIIIKLVFVRGSGNLADLRIFLCTTNY
jgi:hypothetical protein